MVRFALLVLWCFSFAFGAGANAAPITPAFKSVAIGHGIRLHYVEAGAGPTVVFVHGSLSDYDYWRGQVAPFAARYHVIAYSRRYNFPNHNPAIAGYSAVTDADDLAALIHRLQLGQVYLVGHSYGALTGLFLLVRHPEMVRAATLAEPPAVSLLDAPDPIGDQTSRAMFADIQNRMVAPMQRAFSAKDTDGGVSAFIDYVFDKPGAWRAMSSDDKGETLRDAHEWEVMMPRGTLFPRLSPEEVEAIKTPVLLISGAKSYPFLGKTDAILASLLPNSRRLVFDDAGHQVWLKHPEACRSAAEALFSSHP